MAKSETEKLYDQVTALHDSGGISDEAGQKSATPAATLEQYVMDPAHAKSEAEWWASREIEQLRSRVGRLTAKLEWAMERIYPWRCG